MDETVVCSQFKSVNLVTILLKPIENKLACVSQTTEGFLPAFSRFRCVSRADHICMNFLCPIPIPTNINDVLEILIAALLPFTTLCFGCNSVFFIYISVGSGVTVFIQYVILG